MSFHPPVLFDNTPDGKKFGDVHKDAEPNYSIVRMYIYIHICTCIVYIVWQVYIKVGCYIVSPIPYCTTHIFPHTLTE